MNKYGLDKQGREVPERGCTPQLQECLEYCWCNHRQRIDEQPPLPQAQNTAELGEPSMRCTECGVRCYPVVLRGPMFGGTRTALQLYCSKCTIELRDLLNSVTLPEGGRW